VKIVRVDVWSVTMRLSVPYSIAYESVDHATNIFIAIVTDEGYTGYGCAAPDPAVTGETPEGTLTALRDIAEPALHGTNPGVGSGTKS
jgi:L-alanine-DL-glutamate epimerase-like enolase superfamily enzyme